MRRTPVVLVLCLVTGIAAGLASPPTDSEIDRWFSEFEKVRVAFGKDLIDAKGMMREKDYFNNGRGLVGKFRAIDSLLEEAGLPRPAAVAEGATPAPGR
jgi:hypothetical protein